MKRNAKLVLVILALLALTSVGLYAKAKAYVSPAEIDLTRLLAPPPAQDSEQTKNEINEILQYQKDRTPEMASYALADQDVSVFRFADVLGSKFSKENLPLTAAFFENVIANEVDIVGPAKDYWNRPRPSVFDARVKPCVKVPSSAAYPSGHSTAGNLMAIILADMVPERKSEIFSRGWVFAMNRIIGGVHYRSDAEAGRIAASIIASYMFNDPSFKSDFEKAKSEIRKNLGYAVK